MKDNSEDNEILNSSMAAAPSIVLDGEGNKIINDIEEIALEEDLQNEINEDSIPFRNEQINANEEENNIMANDNKNIKVRLNNEINKQEIEINNNKQNYYKDNNKCNLIKNCKCEKFSFNCCDYDGNCFKCCDYNNYDYIYKSCLVHFFQYLLYLGALLIIFIDYNSFSFKLKIQISFFYIVCLSSGFIFIITKIMQCKKADRSNCKIIAIIFILGISFFKGVFFLGIWSIFEDNFYKGKNNSFIYDKIFLKSISKVYILYFSFSIIYYLSLFISRKIIKNPINIYFWINY